MSPGVELNG